jgi:hypothetical protein
MFEENYMQNLSGREKTKLMTEFLESALSADPIMALGREGRIYFYKSLIADDGNPFNAGVRNIYSPRSKCKEHASWYMLFLSGDLEWQMVEAFLAPLMADE